MAIMEIHPHRATRAVWTTVIQPLLSRYAEHRERRRAMAELKSVDPRVLKDMGIDRSEVGSIVYGNASGRRRGYTRGPCSPTR